MDRSRRSTGAEIGCEERLKALFGVRGGSFDKDRAAILHQSEIGGRCILMDLDRLVAEGGAQVELPKPGLESLRLEVADKVFI
jgi:hypothetical protein